MTLLEKIVLWVVFVDFLYRAIKYGPGEVTSWFDRD